MEAAIARTDYVAGCAGGLQGEQAAANVDKLLALARAAELRGEDVRQFVASLQQLADDEAREPEAAVVEERDPHAVRILTVHAAPRASSSPWSSCPSAPRRRSRTTPSGCWWSPAPFT